MINEAKCRSSWWYLNENCLVITSCNKKKLNIVLKELENVREEQEILKEECINSEERDIFELKNNFLNIYDILKKRYNNSKTLVIENSTFNTVYQYLVSTKEFFNSDTYHNLTTQIDTLLEICANFCYNKITSDPRSKKYVDQTLTFIGYVKTYSNEPINKTLFNAKKFEESMNHSDVNFGDPEKMQEDLIKFAKALESLSQLSDLSKIGNILNGDLEIKKNL